MPATAIPTVTPTPTDVPLPVEFGDIQIGQRFLWQGRLCMRTSYWRTTRWLYVDLTTGRLQELCHSARVEPIDDDEPPGTPDDSGDTHGCD